MLMCRRWYNIAFDVLWTNSAIHLRDIATARLLLNYLERNPSFSPPLKKLGFTGLPPSEGRKDPSLRNQFFRYMINRFGNRLKELVLASDEANQYLGIFIRQEVQLPRLELLEIQDLPDNFQGVYQKVSTGLYSAILYKCRTTLKSLEFKHALKMNNNDFWVYGGFSSISPIFLSLKQFMLKLLAV